MITLQQLRLTIHQPQTVALTNGNPAPTVLQGNYIANPLTGGQPGWWVLDECDPQWAVTQPGVANVGVAFGPSGFVVF